MGHFTGILEGAFLSVAKGNFGVKKVEAPSKNPKKCPTICFAPDKKIISGLSKSEVHWYFYVPKKEKREERRKKREERRETRDQRGETREERRETRDEKREKREERREKRDERRETIDERRETRDKRREKETRDE
jgi:hypothetical protein